MILSPDKNNQDLLGTIVEFAYAEYGSALEMLAAAKKAKSLKLKIGYIRHALDEYRHTGLLLQVLSNQVKKGVGQFKREYKFSPQNVILKGYVDKEAYLVEKFPLHEFHNWNLTKYLAILRQFHQLSYYIEEFGDKYQHLMHLQIILLYDPCKFDNYIQNIQVL